MTATHQPFKTAALGYAAIYNYVRDNTTVENPIKIDALFDKLKDDVKNIQQVRDSVKKFRETGAFASVREGQHIVVWWRGATLAKSAEKAVVVKPVVQAQPVEKADMPEVRITKTAIHILAGGVKITIER